jgi:hypothetical protein
VTPPTITLGGSQMYMADPGTIVTIPVSVTGVNSPLIGIGVFDVNGDAIAANRLWWDDLSNPNWPGNPAAIDDVDQLGFDRTLYIRAQTAGIEEYLLVISDANDNYVSTFTIDVGTVTPADVLMGVLFNRAGPAGTGGLDLDTGASTGSMDAAAELVDEGIDISLPNAQNWLKRITGGTNTEIKELRPNEGGLLESFTFESITTKEQIAEIWANGIAFTEVNAAGNLRSNLVEEGSMYVVLREGKYYAVRVVTINETADNNDDNYILDIKF